MPIKRTPLIKLTKDFSELEVSRNAELFYDPASKNEYAGILIDDNQVKYFVTVSPNPSFEEIEITSRIRLVPLDILSEHTQMPLDDFIKLLPAMGSDGAKLKPPEKEAKHSKKFNYHFEKLEAEPLETLPVFCQDLPITLKSALEKYAAREKDR